LTKPGYLIAASTVLLLLIAAAYLIYQPDGPTSAATGDALKAQRLPADLPAIVPTGNTAIDADALYEQAVKLCVENQDVLERTREHDALVDQLVALLNEAATGRVSDGLMDGHLPIVIGAAPDFGPALEDIHAWMLDRAAHLYTHGQQDEGFELTRAVWTMGQRLFERSSRLYLRNTGLDMMESAGGMLFEMSGAEGTPSEDALAAWAEALGEIREAWQAKLELVLGVNPHPGDLVNIALKDEDPMFRFEATLRLGVHRYGVDVGNRWAMQRAIEAAIAGDDPLLAEAGRVADALTLKEKRRLY